jgi:hypothetical protein
VEIFSKSILQTKRLSLLVERILALSGHRLRKSGDKSPHSKRIKRDLGFF